VTGRAIVVDANGAVRAFVECGVGETAAWTLRVFHRENRAPSLAYLIGGQIALHCGSSSVTTTHITSPAERRA